MAADLELPIPTPLAATRDPEPGELVGEYRIEARLGEGGTATVFAAVHPLISKRAAIKVLSRRLCADPHAVERFLAEARTVNQIGHPNIVDVFAFGTMPDGRSYFVMEWLKGETLADRLRRGPLDFPTGLEVLVQVCEALEAAHQKKIIHRDLKPDNVYLVDGRGPGGGLGVKLLDFGLAKLADSDVTVPRTRSGVTVGTAGYMSPEQARAKPVDAKTDVYALGAMAYEMLLGQLPFRGESAIDILAMHLAEPPPPPRGLWPQIPPGLERLLLSMLEKSPGDRPEIAEVRATLLALRGIDIAPRRARSRAGWLVAGAAAIALAAGGGYFVRHRAALLPATAPARASAPAPKTAVPKTAAPKAIAPATAIAPAPAATLVVRVNAPDATIRIDGKTVAEHAAGAQVAIDRPGPHRVEVTAPRWTRFERAVFVGPRASVELEVKLAPKHAAAPPARRPAVPLQSGDYTLDPFH